MKTLAAHCFDTLISALKGAKSDLPEYPGDQPDLEYPIFVTWTKGKEDDLRGCIGTFAA